MSTQQGYVRYDYTSYLELSYTQSESGVWGTACYRDGDKQLTGSTPTIVASDVHHLEYSAKEYLASEYGLYLESIGV